MGLNAQETPPDPISGPPSPTEPEQPDMAYQPPADADTRYSYGYNNPLNFSDPTGHCKRPGECVVAGGGLGVVGDAAYATLMAKILVGYVQTDKIMKASTGSNVGIEPYQGSTLSETLWEISAQDTNGIVAAHGGNAGAALNSYNTLDFLAEGAAMTAMAYGANSMGAAPFGQPLAPRSIYSGNSSSTVLPSRVVMAQYDCSFSADTLVMTEDGLVPISEVTLSTPVLAYN